MSGTISKGLRLPHGLWNDLEKMAGKDRRKVSQYIKIVLEDHVVKRNLRDNEKVGGKKS
jgi:predicted DNA-binding ribbon-helix-helix protein